MMKINIILICLLVLTSCENAAKILRNEKIANTDEFLVKKKQPLIIPPDINIIPKPKSTKKKDKRDEEKIKDILKKSRSTNINKNSNSSAEKSILDKISK